MIYTLVQASLGFKTSSLDWPLLLLIQFGLLVQLLVHIPFIYYIAKENMMIAVDEYYYSRLSMMVTRVRN